MCVYACTGTYKCVYVHRGLFIPGRQLWGAALNPGCPTFHSTGPYKEGPQTRIEASSTEELWDGMPVQEAGDRGLHSLTWYCWKGWDLAGCVSVFSFHPGNTNHSHIIPYFSSKEAVLLLEICSGRKWKGSLEINEVLLRLDYALKNTADTPVKTISPAQPFADWSLSAPHWWTHLVSFTFHFKHQGMQHKPVHTFKTELELDYAKLPCFGTLLKCPLRSQTTSHVSLRQITTILKSKLSRKTKGTGKTSHSFLTSGSVCHRNTLGAWQSTLGSCLIPSPPTCFNPGTLNTPRVGLESSQASSSLSPWCLEFPTTTRGYFIACPDEQTVTMMLEQYLTNAENAENCSLKVSHWRLFV